MMQQLKPYKKIFALCIVIICLAFLTFYFYPENAEYKSDNFDDECKEDESDPLYRTISYCVRSPHIFFVETAGHTSLNVRQACAVESSARHHPNMKVLVLLMALPENLNLNNSLMAGLQALPNVKIVNVDLDVLLRHTPLWGWWTSEKWKNGQFVVTDKSDALRLLLVWKYGGMYLDMDVVVLRSMEHLKNTLFTEHCDSTANGLLIFDREHELMRRSLLDFATNYDPFQFGANGPFLVSRNCRQYCNVSDFCETPSVKCDVATLPPVAAFPIPYYRWRKYFVPSSVDNVTEYFGSSYLIHVWNKLSVSNRLEIGSNSLYESAIKQNCPIAYEYSQFVKYI